MFKKLFNRRPRMTLGVIFVQYDRGKNGGSDAVFSRLQGYLNKINNTRVIYLRVDNKNEDLSLEQETENLYRIGGDNQYREFSGWQKGIETIKQLSPSIDVYLFVNDMFLAPGPSFLQDYATYDLLKKCVEQNAVIGRIDSTGEEYEALGYRFKEWICTNCFFVPAKAVEAMKTLVTIKENINLFLPENIPDKATKNADFFQNNAPINGRYKNWLVEWLTQKWHSKMTIDRATWNTFREKVRNILNESLLSARLQSTGFSCQNYGSKKYY